MISTVQTYSDGEVPASVDIHFTHSRGAHVAGILLACVGGRLLVLTGVRKGSANGSGDMLRSGADGRVGEVARGSTVMDTVRTREVRYRVRLAMATVATVTITNCRYDVP